MPAAVAMLRRMAGSALNVEMVTAFRSIVPTCPVGQHVRLEGDGFAGERGVVIDHARLDPARPVIQLYAGPDNNPLNERVHVEPEGDIRVMPVRR